MEQDIEQLQETELAAPPQRPWLKAFLLVSIVFVSGVVVGVVGTSTFLWNSMINPFRHPPGELMERVMQDMHTELGLTTEQSKQLQDLFDAHRKKMEAFREQVDPVIKNDFETLSKNVNAVLTPEQSKRWDKRYKDVLNHMIPPGPPKGGFGGHGGPGGPGGPKGPGDGPMMPPPFPGQPGDRQHEHGGHGMMPPFPRPGESPDQFQSTENRPDGNRPDAQPPTEETQPQK